MSVAFSAPRLELGPQWFKAGETCRNPVPGSIVVVRHDQDTAKLIRFGERRDARRRHRETGEDLEQLLAYCWSNHVGMVNRDGKLSEQIGHGNHVSELDKYEAALYCVVTPKMTSAQRAVVLARVDWCANSKYSFLGDGVMALDMLDGQQSWAGRGTRMFCSEMSAYCSAGFGLQPDKLDAQVLPSDVSRYFNLIPDPALLR